MSATEIIQELSRLTELERRAIRQKLAELSAEDADIAACNEAALAGALMLDKLEAQ